ncbi:cysteine-rich receptor-like protein kinase 28 [Triticum dicoccoides]|uniref:cysteine-rich receptor-like protein kinase 28 n=1 Tax=Triticum dicoccoides TaxID=85692 RepID=UPI00189099C0|nr:cysteine-rich receptor-like protein kinase 28 [Triticum dicoccoides]
MEQNALEQILEGSMKPTNLSLETLRKITDNFSVHRIIGEGGFGTVYKGVIGNKNVAVKKIMSSKTINQKLFRREVDTQMDVIHENVVRFLGLCSHTVETPVPNPESRGYILAEIRERLLCFEYVNNGSLDKYITDELRGLEWDIRYQIIKGICTGLHYLHVEKRILHMDLKPANILLDNQMVPKITDFGLSRPVENPQTMTTNHFSSP